MKKSFRLTHALLASSVFVAPLVFADTVITGVNTPAPAGGLPYKSTTDGNVEVTPTGQINANATDGYQFDAANKSLIVDANNTKAGNEAVFSSGGSAVAVLAAGKSATITNNTGSTIRTTSATDAAIEVGGDLTNITNNGTLKGLDIALHILAAGTNTTVNNTGGTIISTDLASDAVLIDAGSTGLTLNNSANGTTPGLITGGTAAGGTGISILGNFGTITNASTTNPTKNTISGFEAIIINGVTVSGNIINAGTITGVNDGIALSNAKLTGSITNNSGGVIEAPGGTSAIIIANSSFSSIDNNADALIKGVGTTNGGIFISGTSVGTINNAGTIQTDAASTSAILFGPAATLTGITNSGTITTASAGGAIAAGANSIVKGVVVNGNGYGLVNSGIISNTGAGSAINLAANNVDFPILQQGGLITGDVLLAGAGSSGPTIPVLTMTGGIIDGDVSSSATKNSTINFSGGTVLGDVNLGNGAGGNIVNLSGTSLQALNGGGNTTTFNITGGSFTSLDGGAGVDIMNVNATFTSTGIISDIDTINVNNSGTVYTATGKISNLSNLLNINAGATMIANAGFTPGAGILGTGDINVANTGTLQINNGSNVSMDAATNLGTIRIFDNAVLNLTNLYDQTGRFSPTIQNMTATGFGKIVTTSNANFNAGSTIAPQLGSGEFVLNNFVYPVVQGAAPVTGFANITVVQPPSAILSFTKDNTPNNVVNLIAHTNSLASVALPDIPLSIANALDPLVPTTLGQVTALNPQLLALFGQLQILPDIQSVSNALLQLSPGFNNALPMSSRISMDNAFDSVHARLEAMSRIGFLGAQEANNNTNRDYELFNGVNYGDRNEITLIGQYGLWAKGTATLLDQHKRNFVEGYKADSTGIAIGYDWQPNDFATVGIGQSFTKVNTKDYTDQQNTVKVNSTQTTLYSTFVPYQACQENSTQTIYLDTMLAIASHKYETIRNIVIGNITAQSKADFYGWHYGGQADLGYAFVSADNYLVAPVARFRYTWLDVANYSETGAGGLSLTVKNEPIDEAVAGLGIRLAVKRDFIQAIYVPEFSVFLLYDFAGQAQEMQSNFLGGGNPFYVNSQKPAQYIQQYGAGITAYTSDGYAFNLKGNLEHRDVFFGYSIYAKLEYSWS